MMLYLRRTRVRPDILLSFYRSADQSKSMLVRRPAMAREKIPHLAVYKKCRAKL